MFDNNKAMDGPDTDIYSDISTTKVFTYKCEFKLGNISLTSTMNNFTQIAIQKHLVGYDPTFSGIILEESPFASSKNLVYHLVLRYWISVC